MTATGYPPPAAARRAMLVLSLVGFFVTTDITLTALLIEPMKHDLALTDIQLGLLQGTVFGLAFGFSSIPLGRLIDRGNRVRLLVIGLVVWMLALVGTGLADGIAMLVACRVALGMVAALLIPAAISIISDLYPPEGRSVATSLFVVGQATGQAFGILAGGLAFDALTRLHAADPTALGGVTPWRALYLAAAALGVLLLLVFLAVREPARQERKEGARSAVQAARELWAYRSFLAPLLGAMLFSAIAVQAAAVWAAPVLMRSYQLTPGQFAGWLSAVTLVGGILGALTGGRLGELGRRRGGRAGVLLPAVVASLAGAPLAFFAVTGSVPTFAAMLGLNLFSGAIIATIGVVAITLNLPNEIRGLAIGANVFVSAVFGAATGPAAIAFTSTALGGESMLGYAIAAVGAPCSILAALCFALAMRGGSRAGQAEAIAAQ